MSRLKQVADAIFNDDQYEVLDVKFCFRKEHRSADMLADFAEHVEACIASGDFEENTSLDAASNSNTCS